jgi:hypothetical protein
VHAVVDHPATFVLVVRSTMVAGAGDPVGVDVAERWVSTMIFFINL